MNEHTPGPWTATPQGQIYHQPPMSPGEFIPIVTIGQVYGPSVNPNAKANARLFAAAPELLAACEFAADAIFHGCLTEEAMHACYAAIEKARAAIERTAAAQAKGGE